MSSSRDYEPFTPKLWVPGGHAQTLWRKITPVAQVNHRRERIELKDGDFIDVDWHDEPDLNTADNGTVVLILHGLCGCSKSAYVQSLQYRLGLAGIPSVVMNFRGCSGEVNRLARAYHSGITEDLTEVFDYIANQLGDRKISLTGYSLGANVLLKWLGETEFNEKVHKAVAVSTPFHLSKCSNAMLKGISRFYGKFFLRRLVRDLEIKREHFRGTDNNEQLELVESFGNLNLLETLWQFDDHVTAPLHGFDGAEDYYDKCSSLQFLSGIRTPTLLVQSYNDPIIPPHALPKSEEMSEHIHIDLSRSGGHVGFASASDRYWLENHIIRFLAA